MRQWVDTPTPRQALSGIWRDIRETPMLADSSHPMMLVARPRGARQWRGYGGKRPTYRVQRWRRLQLIPDRKLLAATEAAFVELGLAE